MLSKLEEKRFEIRASTTQAAIDDENRIPTPPIGPVPSAYKQDQHPYLDLNCELDQQLFEVLSVPDYNEQPLVKYHAVIIGAGAAGLELADFFLAYDKKVALVEKNLVCGSDLTFSTVPTNIMNELGQVSKRLEQYAMLGIHAENLVTWSSAIKEMKLRRNRLVSRYNIRDMIERGLHVYRGEGIFTDKKHLRVGARNIQFENCFICTGSKTKIPDIPGLIETGFITPETLWSLSSLPLRIAIIGGGATGCELAQILVNFGVQVWIIEKKQYLLSNFDRTVSDFVENSLRQQGVYCFNNSEPTSITATNDEKLINLTMGIQLHCDEVLICAGNEPNTNIGLDVANVQYDDRRAIKVSKHFRTTNKRIFAVGDCIQESRGTWSQAVDQARMVGEYSRSKQEVTIVPKYPVYRINVNPSIAFIGRSKQELDTDKVKYETVVSDFQHSFKAISTASTNGFIKLHVEEDNSQVVGAIICHENSADLISEVALCVNHGLPLSALSMVAHSSNSLSNNIREIACRKSVLDLPSSKRKKLQHRTKEKVISMQ
ncbi:hypothetical protein PCE1_004755 [Barthelona sp. PCE]